MNILYSATCSVFSNNTLHNWCMESSYVPYVVLTGTVVVGCVLAKACSSANRTLPSQHGSAPPPLAGRFARIEDLPVSAASVAPTDARTSPSHMEAEPTPRVEPSEVPSASAKREKAQLAEEVKKHLLAAGRSIELKKLPPYSNNDELLSLDYLKAFRDLWCSHFATAASKHHLDIPDTEMEPIISSSKKFNTALELLVDFYLGKDDFETALQYGLLALSFENRSINPLIESNLLEKAEETLKKMKDFKDGKGELLTKLGKKYLARRPAQIEKAEEVLKMMDSIKAADLAISIADQYIEMGQLGEALKIVTNPSLAFALGDNQKTFLMTIIDKHIEANQLEEALKIAGNSSFGWLLGDNKKTYLMTIIDKHIGANQLEEAYKIVTNSSFGWLLGDNKKTYLTTIAEKYSSIGEHAKAKGVAEKMGSRFRLKMGLDPSSL